MATPLTNEVKFRIGTLFPQNEREEVAALLEDELGNNLPFCANSTPANLDPVRLAALKLSEGDLAKLRKAIDLAKSDWRDVLVAAHAADDIHAREWWLP